MRPTKESTRTATTSCSNNSSKSTSNSSTIADTTASSAAAGQQPASHAYGATARFSTHSPPLIQLSPALSPPPPPPYDLRERPRRRQISSLDYANDFVHRLTPAPGSPEEFLAKTPPPPPPPPSQPPPRKRRRTSAASSSSSSTVHSATGAGTVAGACDPASTAAAFGRHSEAAQSRSSVSIQPSGSSSASWRSSGSSATGGQQQQQRLSSLHHPTQTSGGGHYSRTPPQQQDQQQQQQQYSAFSHAPAPSYLFISNWPSSAVPPYDDRYELAREVAYLDRFAAAAAAAATMSTDGPLQQQQSASSGSNLLRQFLYLLEEETDYQQLQFQQQQQQQQQPPQHQPSNLDSLLHLAAQVGGAGFGGNSGIRGADRQELDSRLPAYRFSPSQSRRSGGRSGGRGGNCVVCLTDFEARQQLRGLACGHEFHARCVDRWLKQNRSCPICRADAISGQPQKLQPGP